MKWNYATLAATLALVMTSSTLAQDKPKTRFFEMRTYIAHVGKTEVMHARFRNHTNKLFVKHGIELIGYWTPASSPASGQADDVASRTLVYILAYPSREAREASWKAFIADPEWNRAKTESEKDGVLVEKITSTYLTPTDYSPIK